MTSETVFSASENPAVLSVSALNQSVARLLERSFPLAWVSGEISNFTRAASGHWYFTLKDEGAQVRAVMFRGRAQYAGFMPREGDKVEVRALVTLYAPRGDYQLNVEAIRKSGIGNLYEAFQRLKEKLGAEGLFDAGRKRPLPVFPKAIGVVTSPQAAALRDVLTALRRRAPHVAVILYPAPVQGEGAGEKIAQAIALASKRRDCDVLVVCRGGGSMEDLWSFNEEAVARAIAAAEMPVIVGVGHETDFTIADFVSDLRAPTPTAAAELAAPRRLDCLATLEAHAADLTRTLRRMLSDHAQDLDWLSRRIVSPASYAERQRLQLNALSDRMSRSMDAACTHARHELRDLRTRLAARLPRTALARAGLSDRSRRLAALFAAVQAKRAHDLALLSAQLELLSPQRTLDRGYAIIVDDKRHIVRDPARLKPGQPLEITLAKGTAEITVGGVQPRLDDI